MAPSARGRSRRYWWLPARVPARPTRWPIGWPIWSSTAPIPGASCWWHFPAARLPRW